ncbi:MAG: ComEC/Rec2 family competence protein [Candidatus Ornithospirochaeta sp.]|nr:ComEC/Rec2 family competence protein [Candidatus Ornithospirochaeta sp.]
MALLSFLILISFFQPSFFSRPLLVVPLVLFLAFLPFVSLEARSSLLLFSFSFLLISSSIGSSVSSYALPSISAIEGVASSDTQKGKGHYGFRLDAYECMDERGARSDIKGVYYIASDLSDVLYGDRVRVHGSFSEGLFAASSIEILERGSPLRMRYIAHIRRIFLPLGDAGTLSLMLLASLSSDGSFLLKRKASDAGLSHVLALSGMHLSALTLLLGPVRKAFPGLPGRAVIASFLILFAFSAGSRPSLSRALLLFLLSPHMAIADATLASFLIQIALHPYLVADAGMALSYLAFSGILMFSEGLFSAIDSISPLPEGISRALSLSISAQLLTVPVSSSLFSSISLSSILTSFPAGAIAEIYLILSIISLFIPPFSHLLASAYPLVEKAFSFFSDIAYGTEECYFAMLGLSAIAISYHRIVSTR